MPGTLCQEPCARNPVPGTLCQEPLRTIPIGFRRPSLSMDPVTLYHAINQVLPEIAIIPHGVHAFQEECIRLAQRCTSQISQMQDQLHRHLQLPLQVNSSDGAGCCRPWESGLRALLRHLLRVRDFMSKFTRRSYLLKFWKRSSDRQHFQRYELWISSGAIDVKCSLSAEYDAFVRENSQMLGRPQLLDIVRQGRAMYDEQARLLLGYLKRLQTATEGIIALLPAATQAEAMNDRNVLDEPDELDDLNELDELDELDEPDDLDDMM